MSDDRLESPTDAEQLDEAYAAYLQAEEAGAPLDRKEFTTKHPELADELTAHEKFDRLTSQLRETIALPPQGDELELPAGTVVGDYEIVEEIGRHGQGVVYKAQHLKFKEQIVALKTLRSGSKATADEVRLFVSEIDNQANLDHPHIVPVYGGGEHDGRLYFTMKLIEEGDLTQATADGPISPREAAEVVAKIARAVHHAHQRQILHRDLKPHNVLLDAERRPFVADFGLSLRSDKVRSTAEVAGAPAFMSPEQTRGEATVLSDVYGLGTILYWLLTGKAPFDGESLQDTLDKVQNEQPVPPHKFNPQLTSSRDRYLEMICLKCLEKDPEQRYGSAETLADDLERWLRDEPPLDVAIRKRDRLRLWCTRNPLFAGLTVTVLATLFLVMMAAGDVIRSQKSELSKTKKNIKRHLDENNDVNQEVIKILEYEIDKGNLQKLLQENDRPSLQQFCYDCIEAIPHRNLVATIFIVGTDRINLADSKPKGVDLPVAFREYVAQGFASKIQEDTFVSDEIYLARSDGLWKYPIVARIRDEQRKILGLLVASIAPESSKAYQRQEDLISELTHWTGIALAPLAILLVVTVWFTVRRVRNETNK